MRNPLDALPVPVPGRSPEPPAWLEGATVLVTGASSGIGAELARLAAATAGTVVLVARRRERLDELAAELTRDQRGGRGPVTVDVRPADLASPEGVDALVREVEAAHGGVDVLVNNAGFGDYGLLEDADPATLARMIAVNVTAPTLLTRALLPAMVRRGRGGVIFVGSGAGQQPMPGAAVYSATKAYVDGLAEAVHAEVTGAGVTVTQVQPGPVATEFDDVSGMKPLTGRLEAVRISPQQCAREAWAGFLAGQALVYPGAAVRAMLRAGSVMPRAAMRPALSAQGARMRRARRQG